MMEAQRLHAFIGALEKAASVPVNEPAGDRPKPAPAGAGGGGVILAPGKDEPRGARLVGEHG
jgi:hypothetical protein